MGRVRTQLDRRALSCFHQRVVSLTTKYILERQKINICFGSSLKQVLHDTIAERVNADPFSSGYLDKAYNMANHMATIGRYQQQL